jgi:hypothetical protein
VIVKVDGLAKGAHTGTIVVYDGPDFPLTANLGEPVRIRL